jgi:hypothetical protein
MKNTSHQTLMPSWLRERKRTVSGKKKLAKRLDDHLT